MAKEPTMSLGSSKNFDYLKELPLFTTLRVDC